MRKIVPHALILCSLLLLSSSSVSARETLHSLEGKVLWPGMLIGIFRVHSVSQSSSIHSFHELLVCRR